MVRVKKRMRKELLARDKKRLMEELLVRDKKRLMKELLVRDKKRLMNELLVRGGRSDSLQAGSLVKADGMAAGLDRYDKEDKSCW